MTRARAKDGRRTPRARAFTLVELLVTDEIENQIRSLVEVQNEKYILISVHPILHAFLTKGFPSIRMKWYMKFRRYIHLQQDKSLSMLQYRFYNRNEEEIKMVNDTPSDLVGDLFLARAFPGRQSPCASADGGSPRPDSTARSVRFSAATMATLPSSC